MAQEQIQEQQQALALRQTQSVTQQQLLQAQLIELPITQLLDRVNAEMDDNPALEVNTDEDTEFSEFPENPDNAESSDSYEQEQRQSALDDALESIGRDDEELPCLPRWAVFPRGTGRLCVWRLTIILRPAKGTDGCHGHE